MFQRSSKGEHADVELDDLPSRDGARSSARRTGYTPPQFLSTTSSGALLDMRHAMSAMSGIARAEYSSNSPMTSADFTFPPPSSPNAEQTSGLRTSIVTPGSLDMITTQIHRALGVTNDGSAEKIEQRSPSTLHISAPDDVQGSGSAWHESQFRDVLGADTVDLDEMRRLVWAHGVPERPWMRALVWKLLVGLLPPDRADWENEIAARRAEYWNLVSELSVEPTGSSGGALDGDHPLCDQEGSRWREHFRDAELRAAIGRDISRNVAFSCEDSERCDALGRILFVAAKRLPALRYRQGMHDLAAPFVVTFCDAPFADVSDAEADSFYCFETVMREMTSIYASTDALARHVRELQALLRIKDPQLERHLTHIGVNTNFFGIRWLRVWLTHEFPLPSVLRIWDSLLTAEVTVPWLRYVCVAMVIRIRDELLAGDFAACMKLLLHYPPCNIGELLRIADRLRTSNVVILGRAVR